MAEAAEAGVTVGEVGVTVSAAPVRRGRTYSSDGYLQLDLSDRTSEQQAKEAQVLSHLQRYLKVTIEDGRIFLGRFNSFDCEGNIILADAYQLQADTSPQRPEYYQRQMGQLLILGKHIVRVEAKPSPPKLIAE